MYIEESSSPHTKNKTKERMIYIIVRSILLIDIVDNVFNRSILFKLDITNSIC